MAQRRPRFEPRHLLRQVLLQQPALSFDGERVAYVRRTVERGEYRTRIWSVPYAGGRGEQLTAGDLDARPRFSPDGSALLFLSKRPERVQPWLLPLAGGEPRQLVDAEGDVTLAEWSPDGRRVLLLAPSGEDRFRVGDGDVPVARRIRDLTWRYDGRGIRDQYTSAWIADVRSGRVRRVTAPDFEVTGALWHPDGDRIGFLADRSPDAALVERPRLWQLAVAGGRPRELAALRQHIASAAWSPRGRLAVIGNDGPSLAGWVNLSLHAAERGELRRLAARLDRPLFNATAGDVLDLAARFPPPLAWLDDESMVALVSDRGRALPYGFSLDSGYEPLVRDGEVIAYAVTAASGRVVVAASVDGRAPELYAVEDGALRRLTGDGSRWLRPYARAAERVHVRHRDGHQVEGFLLRARGRRRRALVLHVHGGPYLAHGPTPWLEMLALADAGFDVLAANPRGSVGYGEDYARAIHGAWGEVDQTDFLRLVDWAIGEGIAERGRVGVLGLSYGGFTVNYLLGRHPGRFAAAVSENPVTDYFSEYGSSDAGTLVATWAAGVEPWEDPERMRAAAPLAEIHRNEAPLLLLQCEGDLRCPPHQSDIVFTLLRSLGRHVELVRYPEESHLLLSTGRPDRRVDRIERIVEWFRRYLG